MADRPKSIGPESKRHSGRRRALALLAVVSLGIGSGSGCTMMNGIHQGITNNEALDEFMVGYRNRAWSARSWHNNKHKFCDRKHLKDFQAGYRQGYEDVAAGGNGCSPTMAPSEYWGWKYQSPEGQAKVNAWFESYPLGARAAEEDGLGNWGHIQTMLPTQQVAQPAGPLPGPLPTGGGPTPISQPMLGNADLNGTEMIGTELMESSGVGGAGINSGSSQPVDYNQFDFSSVPMLRAGDVPTAASGR